MLSNNKFYVLTGLVIIFIIHACDQSEGHDYFPLQEGAYWRYNMDYETMDGHWHTPFVVENFPAIIKDNKTIYVRRTLDGRNYHYEINDKGLLMSGHEITVDRKTKKHINKHYVFKFPLKVGQSWLDHSKSRVLIKTGPPQKTVFRIRANVPVKVEIESINDTIEVPAGRFKNCLRLHLTGSGFFDAGNYVGHTIVIIDETNWYAPGVGLVKSVRKESTTDKVVSHGQINLELEEFIQ